MSGTGNKDQIGISYATEVQADWGETINSFKKRGSEWEKKAGWNLQGMGVPGSF